MSGKVIAYELDPEKVGGNDQHGYTFGGFPGVWQVGRPTLPEALGLTVTRMRELIAEFGLPLLEVRVGEKDAHADFAEAPNRMLSGPESDPVQPPHEQIETSRGMIPGPAQSPEPPVLQPVTAAMIARDTAALRGDPVEATLDEMGVEDDETRELAEHDGTTQTVAE